MPAGRRGRAARVRRTRQAGGRARPGRRGCRRRRGGRRSALRRDRGARRRRWPSRARPRARVLGAGGGLARASRRPLGLAGRRVHRTDFVLVSAPPSVQPGHAGAGRGEHEHGDRARAGGARPAVGVLPRAAAPRPGCGGACARRFGRRWPCRLRPDGLPRARCRGRPRRPWRCCGVGACRLRSGASGGGWTGAPLGHGLLAPTGVAGSGARRRKRPAAVAPVGRCFAPVRAPRPPRARARRRSSGGRPASSRAPT